MERVSLKTEEPEGIRKAREDAVSLNSQFLIDEPPYRYYSCGYVVLMFPSKPEVLERNRDLLLEKQWSEDEYEVQLANSRKLWSRLAELPGADSPEELMDILYLWVHRRTPSGDESRWKLKFQEGFEAFSDGLLLPENGSRSDSDGQKIR